METKRHSDQVARELHNALKVMLLDNSIRHWLDCHDPRAVRQANEAVMAYQAEAGQLAFTFTPQELAGLVLMAVHELGGGDCECGRHLDASWFIDTRDVERWLCSCAEPATKRMAGEGPFGTCTERHRCGQPWCTHAHSHKMLGSCGGYCGEVKRQVGCC